MELRLTPTECHLSQCYLLPNTSEHIPPKPPASTRFTYPRGMEGWVDVGDLLRTEMVYPPADGQPSKY